MHFAVEYSKFEALEFLLLIRSKFQCKDEKENTPRDYSMHGTQIGIYLFERAAWEETHTRTGQAEENIRYTDNLPLELQADFYIDFRGDYLHD